MDIIQIPNGNAFTNRDGHTPRWIILHGTAGGTSAQAIASYFKSTEGGANPVSSHYVIGQDGTVVQCVKESDGAWTNGALSAGHDPWWNQNTNPNNLTISIEHCKPHNDNSDALTALQQASSFALIADICTRTGIPARMADASGGITGHFSLDPVSRSRCPGNYPWDALWAYLNGSTDGGGSMAPPGWTNDGTTLTAPNKVVVMHGFRAFILDPKNAWDSNNWPLLTEQHASPLEISNPGLGDGTELVCRWTVLKWRKQTNTVYVSWVGQELLALRALKLPAK